MRSLRKSNLNKYGFKRKLKLIHIFFHYSAKQWVIERTFFLSNLSCKHCSDFCDDSKQQRFLLGIGIKSDWQYVAPLQLIDNICFDIRIGREKH